MSHPEQAACADPPSTRWVLPGWCYERDGQMAGPFSGEEIRRQVEAGKLSRGVRVFLCWQRGDEKVLMETALDLVLGEAEPMPQPERRDPPVAAKSTRPERASGPTQHGPARSERRGHARQPRSCRIPYFAAGSDDDGPTRGVRVVDLSPGGIGVLADRYFEVGSVLTLSFAGKGDRTSLLAAVRVVRASALEKGRWLLGCRFVAELGAGEFAVVMERTSQAGGK